MTTVDIAANATPAQDETACLSHPDGTRRRAFFGVAVAVGAACAGCASSKSSSASAGSTTSAAGSTGAGSSPAAGTTSTSSASGSDSSSSSSSGGAALAATSSVPVGGGMVLAAQKIVLTQPTAGTYKAFTAICTHQGCVVGTVQNGLIVCPCHGSAFHAADGSVANGPASQALAPVAIKVANGQIMQA